MEICRHSSGPPRYRGGRQLPPQPAQQLLMPAGVLHCSFRPGNTQFLFRSPGATCIHGIHSQSPCSFQSLGLSLVPLEESIPLLPSCSARGSLLGSGAAPERLGVPESLVLGGPTSPMVSGALSQSLPEFSGELSTHLGSGAVESGFAGFRRPQGRGSQPLSRRRNMAGV